MEDLLHMTEKEIECVPRIFHTSVFDFVFLPLQDFYTNVSLSLGICR